MVLPEKELPERNNHYVPKEHKNKVPLLKRTKPAEKKFQLFPCLILSEQCKQQISEACCQQNQTQPALSPGIEQIMRRNIPV